MSQPQPASEGAGCGAYGHDVAALIFDFDGLMIDSERVLAEAIIEAVAQFGGTVTFDDLGHLFGTTEADDEWDRLLPEWCGRPVSLAQLEEAIVPVVGPRVDELPLMPGVVELLDAAHAAGWRTAVATGSDRKYVEPRLRRNGVLDRFDVIVTAADVERGKPAPDIYLETARRLGVDPSECVVLEDSKPGCEAATAAGMTVIVCPSAVSLHLDVSPAVRRVTSLTELQPDELFG